MAFTKIGLNITALQNAEPPSYADLNISNTSSGIVNQIPERANALTNGYFGLGIMITLFFYLVWKLGDILEMKSENFSSIRTVGISAGVVALLGNLMILIGYFTNFYHVVIFMGLTLVSVLWVWYEER